MATLAVAMNPLAVAMLSATLQQPCVFDDYASTATPLAFIRR